LVLPFGEYMTDRLLIKETIYFFSFYTHLPSSLIV